jgi:hypothetical protein
VQDNYYFKDWILIAIYNDYLLWKYIQYNISQSRFGYLKSINDEKYYFYK